MNLSRNLLKTTTCLALGSAMTTGIAFADAQPSLVPLPVKVATAEGHCTLTAESVIIAQSDIEKKAAATIQTLLQPATGYAFPIEQIAKQGAIVLKIDSSLKQLGKEGYKLDVTPQGVVITAVDYAGLIYGAQTMRQLMPAQIYSPDKESSVKWTVQCAQVEDQPRLNWRGFMIDVSRHFLTIEDLKEIVDDMAAHKLNLLQLHITDDDGWRIEIKKYPKLTSVGAWRGTDTQLPNRKGEKHKKYGGYYTQEQLKDLVAYAKARNIDIMPEIDVPGHALALCVAYPEVLPTATADSKSAQGHTANVISPAREENYKMLEDIFDEVADIFPFPYIHIGGDEVNHQTWSKCPKIKALMEKENIPNYHELQVYFTKRIEKIFENRGKTIIGWQEVANEKLSPKTGIMAWISKDPAYAAARRGAPAVLAQGQNFYFDMGYPDGENEPPSHWWAGPVSLKRAYEFDPLPADCGLTDAQKKNILGVQAELWTEFVYAWKGNNGWMELKNEGEAAEYKIWPRLAATSEIGWTPQPQRDFDEFRERMGKQFQRYAEAERKFRLEQPHAVLAKGKLTIVPPYKGATVTYTTDGSDPFKNNHAKTWNGETLDANVASQLRMRAVMADYNCVSPISKKVLTGPVGTWSIKGWQKNKPETLQFVVTDHIEEPGRYKISFPKTSGSDGFTLKEISIVCGGKTIAKTTAKEATTALIEIEKPFKGAVGLAAVATVKYDNLNAKGNVKIKRLLGEHVKGTAIESKLTAHGSHKLSNLLDSDPESYFWTNRAINKDESVTWVFPEPTALKAVNFQSGIPNGTKDQLTDAVLEVSENGTDFKEVSKMSYGAAKAELHGKKIKAVRVRATAKSPGWVIYQDLGVELAK